MAPDQATAIVRQLAQGLAAAHARGVIHRDLKPANVLIDGDGNAYISDFGVARSLAGQGLTQSGAVVGTPDYLSPEQARGDAIDARSDLYALGLIFYEMLTGAMPFQGGTLGEILAQRMLRPPPPVTRLKPETPPWIARLVDRLLRVQPAHRLPDAQAVIHAIDTRSVPFDWRPGRRGLAIAAVLALLLAGAGYATWYFSRPAAPAAVASVAPLHRLVVLPVQAPAAVPAARATALTSLLRTALANQPGVAVVDGERTAQALRQLDPTGNATVAPDALLRGAGADRALQVSFAPAAGRWTATARLTGAAAPAQGSGDTPQAALAQLAGQPVFAAMIARGMNAPAKSPPAKSGPGMKPFDLALPACDAACADRALDGYGAGVAALLRGAPAQALDPLRTATATAPGFTPAWIALAEAAQAVGEIDLAYEAVERGQAAAARAPRAVQARLAAERALLDGDAPAAAAQWRQAMAATPDDTLAQLGYARALGAGGDFRGAIAALEKLVARDANDPRAWYELGKFSILAGQAQRAVDEYLVRALVLYNRGGHRYGAGETTNALGIGYARLGQSADAEEQYRKAVELRRAVGNRRGLATSLRNLGNILSQRGKFDEAAGILRQAGELHTALGDRAGEAAVENEIGVLAEERGDYTAALAAFRGALQTWQQIGEKPGIAQALNDIGFAHYQLGAYDDAQAYWMQSAQAYAGLGDATGTIRTQQNLGLLAIARGQWNSARSQLEASLKSAEGLQMLEEAAVSRRNLAELELHQGHLDAAIAQALKAQALFRDREDPRGQADAGLLQVQALLAMHADAQAQQVLKALAPAIEHASAEQRGIAALLQAQLAQRAGDAPAAAAARTRARQFARGSGVRQLQLWVAMTDPAAPATASGPLDRDIAALGHVPLQLQWLQARMETTARSGRADAVRDDYRKALALLRRGDSLYAWRIHELASATCTGSDGKPSPRCGDAAQLALSRLRAGMPKDGLDDFDLALARAGHGRQRPVATQ
ncbi:serine/threonine-protein kinase [Agrilutibacter solisilvae]|uniref:Tetratricopeptide repeat protein n=1 Tax=Agrilutibacter solisilvae TaxID=2763317 RepID=A0A975ARP5_9GAMM|nr:serine/threonine-protein kinase [Lysobacter solisilvae]QSX77170.1 tetratricopeptide repeat protein [Lysobacter solisilvae]